ERSVNTTTRRNPLVRMAARAVWIYGCDGGNATAWRVGAFHDSILCRLPRSSRPPVGLHGDSNTEGILGAEAYAVSQYRTSPKDSSGIQIQAICPSYSPRLRILFGHPAGFHRTNHWEMHNLVGLRGHSAMTNSHIAPTRRDPERPPVPGRRGACSAGRHDVR